MVKKSYIEKKYLTNVKDYGIFPRIMRGLQVQRKSSRIRIQQLNVTRHNKELCAIILPVVGAVLLYIYWYNSTLKISVTVCEKEHAFTRWLSSTKRDTKQKLITRPPNFLFRPYPMVYCRFSFTEPLIWFRDLKPAALFSKQKTNGTMSSLFLLLC